MFDMFLYYFYLGLLILFVVVFIVLFGIFTGGFFLSKKYPNKNIFETVYKISISFLKSCVVLICISVVSFMLTFFKMSLDNVSFLFWVSVLCFAFYRFIMKNENKKTDKKADENE